MWGSATLAIEVSSTSIKVARVTVMAISQGFRLGLHAAIGPGWGRGRASAAAALIRKSSLVETVKSLFDAESDGRIPDSAVAWMMGIPRRDFALWTPAV